MSENEQDRFIEKISAQQGKVLEQIAESAIRSHILKKPVELGANDPILDHKAGVFVTVLEKGQLRGCIGHVYPTDSLINITKEAAVEAAVEDPRFPPIAPEELNEIKVEVTVLGDVVEFDPRNKEELSKISLGEDGLIVSDGYQSGLLLPQVATEYNLDVPAFLEETCQKAGLPKDSWRSPSVHVYKFKGRVF